MDMHEALDVLLSVDQQRQNEGRDPETVIEKLAHQVISELSGVMRGAYPELSVNREG